MSNRDFHALHMQCSTLRMPAYQILQKERTTPKYGEMKNGVRGGAGMGGAVNEMV